MMLKLDDGKGNVFLCPKIRVQKKENKTRSQISLNDASHV
jgi:hypothetical protein